eukprot:Lithocolla_globosa_v1_NODE_1175_length_2811_cov_32.185776.p4 type:complete len:107 gc:universal NODE_1175_length_2811_cov_32.185776:2669-2349(-)
MYTTKDIKPYNHCFANHMKDFLKECTRVRIPLPRFDCQALEKKNHQQVRLYFGKTTRDGGKAYKSSVREIAEIENRILYMFTAYGDKKQKQKKPHQMSVSTVIGKK